MMTPTHKEQELQIYEEYIKDIIRENHDFVYDNM